jgi:hypothetical protein
MAALRRGLWPLSAGRDDSRYDPTRRVAESGASKEERNNRARKAVVAQNQKQQNRERGQ